jgi:hypothetical protein
MSFVTKPNVVSLWDGSLIDLSKIARIGKPELIGAGHSVMRNAHLQVTIDLSTGNTIVIKEYFNSPFGVYTFYREDGATRTNVPLWYCTDGKHRTLDECYHDMTLIKVYADFKKKVDELVDVWKAGGIENA